jgi:hypothetical protein
MDQVVARPAWWAGYIETQRMAAGGHAAVHLLLHDIRTHYHIGRFSADHLLGAIVAVAFAGVEAMAMAILSGAAGGQAASDQLVLWGRVMKAGALVMDEGAPVAKAYLAKLAEEHAEGAEGEKLLEFARRRAKDRRRPLVALGPLPGRGLPRAPVGGGGRGGRTGGGNWRGRGGGAVSWLGRRAAVLGCPLGEAQLLMLRGEGRSEWEGESGGLGWLRGRGPEEVVQTMVGRRLQRRELRARHRLLARLLEFVEKERPQGTPSAKIVRFLASLVSAGRVRRGTTVLTYGRRLETMYPGLEKDALYRAFVDGILTCSPVILHGLNRTLPPDVDAVIRRWILSRSVTDR